MADDARRTAIVTGGGHGIGAAVCERLARDGWQVVVADTDAATAHSVAQAAGGLAITCDVSEEADVERLVRAAVSGYGRLDAIVSNAGINPRGRLSGLTLETWNRVLAVNLTASMLLARAAEDALRATRGAMVLIASTRAHMSEPNTLPYSASKGGLVALTHALSVTLAPDVRVNCISPGWIDTGGAPLSAADHAQHPVGRVGRPEDVAGTVAYLLSEDAGFMTGAELILDGGMTRKMIYV
jgi:NAD(P)-dependent dehydrogenase (short-subunit alcohol dehydrogenase family)